MRLLDRILKKGKTDADIPQFCQLDIDDRIRQIIEWGDKGDNSKLSVIQYAILNDPDLGVKVTAVKRIHFFEDKENIRQFLNSAGTKEIGRICEPYYSMALSRTGLISLDEFEKRMLMIKSPVKSVD